LKAALGGTRAGDYVTVRAGADLMAEVKLGDHDCVMLGRVTPGSIRAPDQF